jgi:hypothetical protein
VSNVIVRRQDGTTCSFARAVADVFEDGYLTVTADHEAYTELQQFRPTSWRSATSFDDHDYPIAEYRNTHAMQERNVS